jgi:hypothetical protein
MIVNKKGRALAGEKKRNEQKVSVERPEGRRLL